METYQISVDVSNVAVHERPVGVPVSGGPRRSDGRFHLRVLSPLEKLDSSFLVANHQEKTIRFPLRREHKKTEALFESPRLAGYWRTYVLLMDCAGGGIHSPEWERTLRCRVTMGTAGGGVGRVARAATADRVECP